MITLLLVAGRSKRFWPLSDKSLWRIAGKTLLEHQVSRLKSAGCTDIRIIGGAHNLKEVQKLTQGMKTVEQKDLDQGMMGALLSALPGCKNEPVLIVGGNDLIDPMAYKAMVQRMMKKDIDGLILARKVQRYFPGGYLTIKGKKMMAIVEKPGEGNEPGNLVNIVAHAHGSAKVLLDALKKIKAHKDDGYEQALDALFKTHHYEALPYEGVWQAVKYPWHALPLTEIILGDIHKSSIHKTASVHPSAVISGPVVLAEGVRVLPHATVVGPCFIGPRTIIGNNALVRQSSVGADCVVGYNTEIVRSCLGNHVWTHSTYLGDSVIADNVSFGAGTVTGNLRLDEGEISSALRDKAQPTGLTKLGSIIGEGSRLGIHVSISPGMKIGRHCFISSHTLLHQDIPDGSFVKTGALEMEIRENRQAPQDPLVREKFRRRV